jgi:hypothetical protein
MLDEEQSSRAVRVRRRRNRNSNLILVIQELKTDGKEVGHDVCLSTTSSKMEHSISILQVSCQERLLASSLTTCAVPKGMSVKGNWLSQ